MRFVGEEWADQGMPPVRRRWSDYGICTATQNIAREASLLAAHAGGRIGNSLWFCRFHPAVAVGRHQAVEREARLDYCKTAGVAVARRVTAGGALYLDPGQQCFGLVVPAAELGSDMAGRLASGIGIIAAALGHLGVITRLKAPNDLEVEGRQKIASVFLAEEGGSALLFGTITVELDLKSAMQALLVPTEKLTVTGLEHARERMTSLAEILSVAPAASALHEALAQAVAERIAASLQPAPKHALLPGGMPALGQWAGGPETIETKDKVAGATLRALIDATEDGTIASLRIATDGHFAPRSALEQLSVALRGVPLANAETAAQSRFAVHPIDAAGFAAADVVRLIARAASKFDLKRNLGLSPEQASGLMLAGDGGDPAATLQRASVMLVPYCAKPNWCKWRHTIDCVECGECEVGDAYAMARERNMEVVTITNFEHLSDTLAKMKAEGVESYVGMCCGEFFLKRHHAFRDSGMDAVLLDIEGATCYELKEEHLAYAGAFRAEARLDLDAVKKVMAQVPAKPAGARPCITGAANRPGEKRRARKSGGGCGVCGCGKAG